MSKRGRRPYVVKMCASVLLISLLVSLFACASDQGVTVSTSTSGSSSAASSTGVVTNIGGTSSSSSSSSQAGTVASSTTTTSSLSPSTNVTSGAASTTSSSVSTSETMGTTTATSVVVPQNKYSDLPIYSPIVNDVVTYSKDRVKVYNSDFRISESLQTELKSLIEDYPLSFTFSLRDLETEAMFSYNDSKSFKSASSIKGPYGLYAGKVFDAGKASLDTVVEYTPDFYMETGSGPIRKYGKFGDTFTAERLEYLMIYESDNSAYFMLSSITGGKKGLNAMVKDLGCDDIIVDNAYWGYLSSKEMGLIWREIYYYGQSGTEGGSRVYELFRKAKYNDLQSYMGYKVVHKSGWGTKTFNDAGVVYYKDRQFVAVVFVERVDVYDETSAKGQFKKVCKFLVKVMKEYKAYCDNGNTSVTEPPKTTTTTTEAAVTTQTTTATIATTTTQAEVVTTQSATATQSETVPTQSTTTTQSETVTTTKSEESTTATSQSESTATSRVESSATSTTDSGAETTSASSTVAE